MPADTDPIASLAFEAEVIHWRGPAPFFFVPLPAAEAAEVEALSRAVTYGWGMIPVAARIGDTAFSTAMFRRDGTYFLPLKDAVRRAAGVTAGDRIAVALSIAAPAR